MDLDPRIWANKGSVCTIAKALKEVRHADTILEEDHGLVLFQAWTYSYTTNGIARFLSNSDIFLGKNFSRYMYSIADIGGGFGGLTRKALETYETYFSTKLKFIEGEKKGLVSATDAESCCFLAICMKNINIVHVDYVFEMIFRLDDSIHPYVFLDSLFETLKICLPSFKLSSGAQLGHQSLVVDVDSFIELEKPFEMIKKEEEDCKEDVKQQQFGTSNSINYNNTNTYDGGDLGVMDLRIYVSASVEFEDLKTKISQRFHDLVSDNDYRLTYSLRGLTRPLWIELESDQDLKKCISLCRSNEITQLPIRIIPVVRHAFRAKSRNAILDISTRLIFPEGGGSPASHICTPAQQPRVKEPKPAQMSLSKGSILASTRCRDNIV